MLYCRLRSDDSDTQGMAFSFSFAGFPLTTALRSFLAAFAMATAAVEASASAAEFRSLGVALGSDGDVVALDAGRWIFAGTEELTQGWGESGVHISAGRYEALDARSSVSVDGHLVDLVAATDTATGGIVLFQGDPAQGLWKEVLRVLPDAAVTEALCLYRDPDTQNISLFTLDALGMLEQRYIYDGSNRRLVNLPVRRDVGVLDAQACVVDDDTGALFVADELFGVRRLSAQDETDALAEPWMMVSPWGVIDGEIEDMAISDDGALWLLVPDAMQILRRARDGEISRWAIPESLAPAAIAVSAREGSTTQVLIYDEDSGDVWSRTMVTDGQKQGTGAPEKNLSVVVASAETGPVRRYGDAADDPVVLVSEATRGEALILGTDKRAGLAVYGLDGQQRQFLPVGRVNNVDGVGDVLLAGERRTLVAASNRSSGSVSLFDVEGGVVRHLGDHGTGLDDVYGLCMYASPTGVYVFINDTSGAYEQYRVNWSGDAPDTVLVRAFTLPSQPEGCAADTETRRIYLGEEAAGVWWAGAEPDGDAPQFLIPLSDALVADVEGMDIYRGSGQKLLVVSSQGSDSYAVYDLLNEHALVASFRIQADLQRGVDGVSETDGLAVFSAALPGYPRGVLVVQDGRNRLPGEPQNFKIVDWRVVQALVDENRQ